MNFPAFKAWLVSHYAGMARIPGAYDQAKHSAREFAREFPDHFGDLPQLVKAELEKDNEAKETA